MVLCPLVGHAPLTAGALHAHAPNANAIGQGHLKGQEVMGSHPRRVNQYMLGMFSRSGGSGYDFATQHSNTFDSDNFGYNCWYPQQ